MNPAIRTVFETLRPFVSQHGGVPIDEVTLESDLYRDIDLDSLQIVEIMMDVEEAYGVTIGEYASNPTFVDGYVSGLAGLIFTASYLDATGRLDSAALRWERYGEGARAAMAAALAELGFQRFAADRLSEMAEFAASYGVQPLSVGFLCACIVELLTLRGVPLKPE